MSDIKMSDWFKLPIDTELCFHGDTKGTLAIKGVKYLSSHKAIAIEEAINNHDRLVEENTKMKETISYLEAENKKAVDFIYELGDKLGESASKMRRGF